MLSSITNRKPGQRLAFIQEANPDHLAECLVAFANSDGGTIVIGLDSDGRPVDGIWEEEVESALRLAAGLCRPPVPSSWQAVEQADGAIVSIEVNRGRELHSLVDGRVLIRSGRENRVLDGLEIGRLSASKSSPDFETELLPGARQEDFDQEILDAYLAKR